MPLWREPHDVGLLLLRDVQIAAGAHHDLVSAAAVRKLELGDLRLGFSARDERREPEQGNSQRSGTANHLRTVAGSIQAYH